MLRSFLFVPADSERKLAKAPSIDADAIILDLEDAVIPERKEAARRNVAEYLQQRKSSDRQSTWVRINALDTKTASRDLDVVVPAAPDGLMLPKASSAQQVQALARMLDELEAETGQTVGRIGIIPLITETAAAVFQLGSYTPDIPRLCALTWGAEDLSVIIGATRTRDEKCHWLPVFQQVQSMVLLAAGAARVPAIETIYSQFTDGEGLQQIAEQARQQGFTGMLAIHPDQVPIINAVFAPNAGEIAYARRVAQKFASADGAGVIELDGKMLDEPHLRQAKLVLDVGK
jgi:citrate lyase subunit beta/citryl-CoA lyase